MNIITLFFRLLSTCIGTGLLWMLCLLLYRYFTGTSQAAGAPDSLIELMPWVFFTGSTAAYALYYGIMGRTLLDGFFKRMIGFLGMAALYLGVTTMLENNLEDAIMGYGMLLGASLFLGYIVSKIEWKYKYHLLKAGAGCMALLGGFLLLSISIQIFQGNAQTADYMGKIPGLVIFTTGFACAFFFLTHSPYTVAPPSEPSIQSLHQFEFYDSICLGAWAGHLNTLLPAERHDCLRHMAQETNVPIKKLEELTHYAHWPAMLDDIERGSAYIKFFTPIPNNNLSNTHVHVVAGLVDHHEFFTVNESALELLFQPIPLFLVEEHQITLHRSMTLLSQYVTTNELPRQHLSIYDGLGYAYPVQNLPSEGISHYVSVPPLFPAQKKKLEELLSTFLTSRDILLPKPLTLPGLVSAMLLHEGYS